MIKRALVLFCALLAVARPPGVDAQTIASSVQGRVTDPTGAFVAGAQVQVVNQATGARAATRSDDRGWFVVTGLAPGAYRVEVGHDGFRRLLQVLTLAVNQTRRLDAPLQPGPVTDTVTVRATEGLVDRATPSLTSRVDGDGLVTLPLDGRNFLDLALLAPGAAPAAQGSAGSVRGDFAFNVNGAREDANTFLLDGVLNVDPKLNSAAVRPPVDGIREFEVITNLPDASFGRGAGAQVNVVTKSGTNTFAGNAYDYFRTTAFNARNYFAPETEDAPAYRRHQFGGTIGGPLVKDRLFLFADYEGTRLTEGLTRVTNVPTAAERLGDFRGSLLAPPINPFTQQPFPGGIVPVQAQNPIGRNIAALYPLPNREAAFANYVSSPEQTERADQFDVRMDARGATDALTLRYSFADRHLFEPFGGAGFSRVPGYGNDVPRRAQNLMASHTRSIGASAINDARVSWTRVTSEVRQEGQGVSLNQQVGLPELSPNPRDWGLSFITVSGLSPIGQEYNNPQRGETDIWQIQDTLGVARGSHLLKVGGELRFTRQVAFRDVQARGLLQFTNQAFSRNALADLLLGLPTVTAGAQVDNPQNLRTHSYALFLQDNIHVSPTLTLSAGLRYEFNAPPVDADDRVTLYDPSVGSIVPVGEGGVPRAGYEADRNNLAPRVGATWAATTETIVRGGYGVSYDQAALAPNEFLYFNAPYYDLNTYFSLPPHYLLTLDDPFPAQFPLPLPESATAVQRDLRTAHLHHWNLNVQRQLGTSRSVEVAYVGTRGRNLIAARDINQPAPSPASPNLRPNPFFADILAIESRARSTYDALQLRFDQRLDRTVSFTAAYTLGRSHDDASGFFPSATDANFPQDSNNPEAEWGPSNFDVRHRMTISGLWQLPFGEDRRWFSSGIVGTCLGNWDLLVLLAFQSGRPFTVAIHPDIDNSNTGRANLGFGANDRPNLVGDPSVASPGTTQWFDTQAYALPPFGTFGDVGRNTLDGPGYSNVNLALVRSARLGHGLFQLRLEVYNVFNAANFGQPDNFLGSPTFGQILSAGAPRRLQLGLRYGW